MPERLVKKYDNHVPSWVKGFIGTISALILVPSFAMIIVVKFGGFEEVMHKYAEMRLEASRPEIRSNSLLKQEIERLNDNISEMNKSLDKRMATIELVQQLQQEQIEKGFEQLREFEKWKEEMR